MAAVAVVHLHSKSYIAVVSPLGVPALFHYLSLPCFPHLSVGLSELVCPLLLSGVVLLRFLPASLPAPLLVVAGTVHPLFPVEVGDAAWGGRYPQSAVVPP